MTRTKMSNKYQYDIAAIDGGLAGLVTAIELVDHDKKVLILEWDKQEKFGGLEKESFDWSGIDVEFPMDIQLFKGKPVVVDVNINYSKPIRFTQGVMKTMLKRSPPRDKTSFITRAMPRNITG